MRHESDVGFWSIAAARIQKDLLHKKENWGMEFQDSTPIN
jgi:hypothetical protein